MALTVKICGLSTEATVDAAIAAGADFVGFVFYAKSPRWVTPARAADLARIAANRSVICGLFVDAGDEFIRRTLDIVDLGLLQLHGKETPEECARLRERTGCRVMKALGIATDEDVRRADSFAGAADWLLFDAKPSPALAALPGGNGVIFDWSLLAGRAVQGPWMLSGGLSADNLRPATGQTSARAVDVSSGVETSPGIKSPELIRQFLFEAKRLG